MSIFKAPTVAIVHYGLFRGELRSSDHCLHENPPGSAREEERSDLSEDLHDSDGGALAKDESSADQGHHSPNCEDDSGEETVQVGKKTDVTTEANVASIS